MRCAAVQATAKPVVVVVLAGRPLGPGRGEDANGLRMAWQGGTETGGAVADVLFGRRRPERALVGDVAVGLRRLVGDRAQPGRPVARRGPADAVRPAPGRLRRPGIRLQPATPSGTGFSYTTVATSNLSAPPRVPARGPLPATDEVRDTGGRDGTEIVQARRSSGRPTTWSPRRGAGWSAARA
ncbi:MAG TPA: glycoside hydrolase family 3 C-terminal domain-containing protein [Solirubrobacteraceae bacterium]|nr:glycoside hydrolase family 3 C-terminal domain-containing protein [Solirubrobacteraceae bacterium]